MMKKAMMVLLCGLVAMLCFIGCQNPSNSSLSDGGG